MTTKNTIPSIPKSDPSDKSDRSDPSVKSVPSDNALESLVPPLDLCKQIPEGKFENSALVWTFDDRLMPRTIMIDGVRHYYRGFPAPTLQEILNELPKYNENEVTLACVPSFLPGDKGRIFGEAWSVGYTAKSSVTDATPATAALKLWLELNPPNQKSGEIK